MVVYQVCCQSQHVGDTLVLQGLISTPCFDKHTDPGQRGVILQRRYHQTIWELGHLKQHRNYH